MNCTSLIILTNELLIVQDHYAMIKNIPLGGYTLIGCFNADFIAVSDNGSPMYKNGQPGISYPSVVNGWTVHMGLVWIKKTFFS